jgi:hypothetical protein
MADFGAVQSLDAPHVDASVVISTHNRLEGLAGLLADLADQKLDGRVLEVLVVDSVLGDDCRWVVAQAAGRGLTVRHLLAKNIIAAKRNRGAEEANGRLLIFLDDDMRVGPYFVMGHLSAHEGQPELTVVSGAVYFPVEWVARSNYYRFKSSRQMNSSTRNLESDSVSGNHVVTMNCSIMRRAYAELGGFDEEYVQYGGEDLDFGFRCLRAGASMLYSERAEAEHREVATDIVMYATKLYTAAYYGLPMVLQKNPEAVSAPTIAITMPYRGRPLRYRLVGVLVGLLAHPFGISTLVRVLRRTDESSRLYVPAAFVAMTLLITRRATSDLRSGNGFTPDQIPSGRRAPR